MGLKMGDMNVFVETLSKIRKSLTTWGIINHRGNVTFSLKGGLDHCQPVTSICLTLISR